MTPEEKSEYMKQYRIKNKKKLQEYKKGYNKIYYKKNKDKHIDRYQNHLKQYRQTDEGKKLQRIGMWKLRGLIHDDYNELYDKYINTEYCELCSVKLTEDRYNTPTTRVLDHDHQTGLFRNVLCHSCNVKRG